MAEPASPAADAEFQYGSAVHQADTAIAGMWLFLATEVLFFGGLVFAWMATFLGHGAGFRLAAGHTNLHIGSANTVLLVTSSAVCTWAVRRPTDSWRVVRGFALTALLGFGFLVLKGVEWLGEFHEHLFPGPGFALGGLVPAGGAEQAAHNGAQLFYTIYFVATGLHGVHMLVGLGLLAVTGWRAWRGQFERPGHTTPVEVTALYWSFVDLVWLVLFPVIYLVARP